IRCRVIAKDGRGDGLIGSPLAGKDRGRIRVRADALVPEGSARRGRDIGPIEAVGPAVQPVSTFRDRILGKRKVRAVGFTRPTGAATTATGLGCASHPSRLRRANLGAASGSDAAVTSGRSARSTRQESTRAARAGVTLVATAHTGPDRECCGRGYVA